MSNEVHVHLIHVGGAYQQTLLAHLQPIVDAGGIVLSTASEVQPQDIPAGALRLGMMSPVSESVDVFMSHGIADKNWRNAPSMGDQCTVFVSGPAWVEKLVAQGINPNRVKTVGYPLMDLLFRDGTPRIDPQPNHVLWAPTHINSPSSYPVVGPLVAQVCRHLGFSYDESVHPYHRHGGVPTLAKVAHAQVVVADTGSTVYEAWALGRPVVFPDWLIQDPAGRRVSDVWPGSFEQQIFKEGIGRHATCAEQLEEMIADAMATGITPEAKTFIEGIFPRHLRGTSGKAAAEWLQIIARQGGNDA